MRQIARTSRTQRRHEREQDCVDRCSSRRCPRRAAQTAVQPAQRHTRHRTRNSVRTAAMRGEMKSAIATAIATTTAIEPHAHEGSLAPIAARSGGTSSFRPCLICLRLYDVSSLILIKIASLPRSCSFAMIFSFLISFAQYVMLITYSCSVRLSVFL